ERSGSEAGLGQPIQGRSCRPGLPRDLRSLAMTMVLGRERSGDGWREDDRTIGVKRSAALRLPSLARVEIDQRADGGDVVTGRAGPFGDPGRILSGPRLRQCP